MAEKIVDDSEERLAAFHTPRLADEAYYGPRVKIPQV